MNTRERAIHLAAAAGHFPFLGINNAGQLLEVVRCELGNEEAFDRFVPYGGHFARAFAPDSILHILSGATPHAALQTLIRGLLLDSMNWCKLPGEGLPETEQFRAVLPAQLARRVAFSNELPEAWLSDADAIIVFGSDETIAHFRPLVSASQIFLPHGHKVSVGIVLDDPRCESVAAAARDASIFDQLGCLSPHAFYVSGDAAGYAARLAGEMRAFNDLHPRRALSPAGDAEIAKVRDDYQFRAANGDRVRVFESAGSTAWTVIYDESPTFVPSCLNRVVFVRPLPADLALRIPHLGAVGLWPCTAENATRFQHMGASRFCPIGRMQEPSFTWHQDGAPTLVPLVRWVDLET